MRGIKRLLGSRIYLEAPKKEETKVIVDENTKDALQREFLKSMNKLKVVAVSDNAALAGLSEGDVVLVDPSILARTPLVPIKEDLNVICVNFYDVMHIWP